MYSTPVWAGLRGFREMSMAVLWTLLVAAKRVKSSCELRARERVVRARVGRYLACSSESEEVLPTWPD